MLTSCDGQVETRERRKPAPGKPSRHGICRSTMVAALLLACNIGTSSHATDAVDSDQAVKRAIHALGGQDIANGDSFSGGRWIDAQRFSFNLVRTDGQSLAFVYDAKTDRIAPDSDPPTRDDSISWPAGADVAGQPGPREVASLNGRYAIGFSGKNLMVRNLVTGRSRLITRDGTQGVSYGDALITSWSGQITVPRAGLVPGPSVLWSPKGDMAVSFRADARKTPVTYYLEYAPPGAAGQRPKLHTTRTAYPGEDAQPLLTIVVLDPLNGTKKDLNLPLLHYPGDPIRNDNLWWSRDGSTIYIRAYREGQTQLWKADPHTGKTTLLIGEDAKTLVRAVYLPNQLTTDVPGSNEIVWFSQRDDYGHLYRYAASGALLNKITRGRLVVSAITGVFGDWVYFLAGVDDGQDPYRQQFFRARLDGSIQEQLTHDGLDHDVTAAPGGARFVLDSFAVDRLRRTSIVDREGKLLAVLADPKLNDKAPKPERIEAAGRDGQTPIWGVMYKPSDFDPAKRYPIVHYVYGGPWTSFSPRVRNDRRVFYAQALAELGFVVLVVDGMGTPGRTRSFNTVAFGKGFKDCGLPDAISVMQGIAKTRSYLDLGRVGITGNSGGGYCALRGMLDYPDVFKVGVSSSGSHDQRIVGESWGETYIGAVAANEDAYHLQSNVEAASHLQGKLLLMHGMMDDDTNAANSFQVANALIAADKDFDLFVFPNANHALTHQSYYYKKLWPFLTRHLQSRELDTNQIRIDGL